MIINLKTLLELDEYFGVWNLPSEYINVGFHCYFLRGRAFNTIPKVLVIFL